jgi:hypothetical protein
MTTPATWDESVAALISSAAEMLERANVAAVLLSDEMGERYRFGDEHPAALSALAATIEALADEPTLRARALLETLPRRARRRGHLGRALAAVHADDLNDLAHLVDVCIQGRKAIAQALATEWGRREANRRALVAMLSALEAEQATAENGARHLAKRWPAGAEPLTQATANPQPQRSKRARYCAHNRRHLAAATQLDDPAPSEGLTLNAYGATCRRFSSFLEAHS